MRVEGPIWGLPKFGGGGGGGGYLVGVLMILLFGDYIRVWGSGPLWGFPTYGVPYWALYDKVTQFGGPFLFSKAPKVVGGFRLRRLRV